jgi:hypothetical protein
MGGGRHGRGWAREAWHGRGWERVGMGTDWEWERMGTGTHVNRNGGEQRWTWEKLSRERWVGTNGHGKMDVGKDGRQCM